MHQLNSFSGKFWPAWSLWMTVLSMAMPAQAQRMPVSEMPGASDHPLISRYTGSVLHASAAPLFSELAIPTGPLESTSNGWRLKQATQASGELSGRFYVAPHERSALEVFRNYELALRDGGFKILFKCELKDCDRGGVLRGLGPQQMEQLRFPQDRLRNPLGPFSRDIRFVSAEYRKGGRAAYVQLYVAEPDSVWQAPVVMQLALEPKPMDEGQVLVKANGLRQALGSEGRIALYGLNFETGKAEIRPESKAQLEEMAQVLKADAQLRVAIVGHTDTEGALDGNLRLSQARAEAVMQALVREHGIAAARLDAKGLAAYAPVASNATPEGRAKNRRVEMVQR
jgi:OOP family OmpA-OmpF porin